MSKGTRSFNILINSSVPIITEKDGKKLCKKVIERFLEKNSINIEELKRDNKKLHELVLKLKTNYKISLRNIADNLKINREKIRKIFNNK